MNIAIFASGRGSNFQALLKAVKNKTLKAKIVLLVCDNPKAPVLEKARQARIKTLLLQRKAFNSTKDFEQEIISHLREEKIDLVALAGFMRILSPFFIRQYKNRILNIHPSLLPAFKGAHAIADAFNYGVKVTGVTIHFVDEQVDNGPIILQEPVAIKKLDTVETLEIRIHRLEHMLYPKAIQLLNEKKIFLKGRKIRAV